MPEMDGVEAALIIKQRWPHVKIIILTTFQDVPNASKAISAGAEGYLLKIVQPRHLAEAIRIVNSGGSLIPMETAKLLVSQWKIPAANSTDEQMSNKENQILSKSLSSPIPSSI